MAVIGVLSSLLLPSLARSKSQAQGIYCQNNTRQLILGCLMYCDDNGGFFPYNLAGTNAGTNINWAGGLLDWEPDSGNTNTSLLTEAALGPYLAQSSAVFHCPADTALSAIQRTLGWQNRVRSYSMNSSVGNVGVITEKGYNIYNPGLVQFFKLASIPAAAQIFVFTEEHPDTIYDGYFINMATSNEWHRLPASYHGGSANISFADGHVELHHWQDASTKPPPEPDTAEVFASLPPGQQDDFNWVIAHMSVVQQPQQYPQQAW